MPTTLAVPHWAVGTNYQVQITPQDVSATALFSNNAVGTFIFTGRVEEDSFSQSLSTKNFSPIGSFNSNPVPMEYSGVYTITEIVQALPLFTSGSQLWDHGNILEKCIQTSWYHKIVVYLTNNRKPLDPAWATETPSNLITWTFYGLLTDLRRTSPKGVTRNTATLLTVPVGNGAGGFLSNPTVQSS